MDHLGCAALEITTFFVDSHTQFYKIKNAQLYSNTPSDFDFKLDPTQKLTEKALIAEMQTLDLVFPVIHGNFGEDGQLQAFLEQHKIPFVGSSSQACSLMFHKYHAAQRLKKHGYPTLPSLHIENADFSKVSSFFHENNLTRAVVKPVNGGSSLNVFSVGTPQEATTRGQEILKNPYVSELIVEPFCQGTEFTVLVTQDRAGKPTALVPSEINCCYNDHQIYNFRRKYLPSVHSRIHTPPSWPVETINKICSQAENIFSLFEMADFARLDGWVNPDGSILFTDLNPISGMEQNSFLFRQASVIGKSHTQILRDTLSSACNRQGITPPKFPPSDNPKKPIFVVFGGNTAERQVSFMSGTNAWLKLRKSEKYAPIPFCFDGENAFWKVPYSYCLNHTVEELLENCHEGPAHYQKLKEILKDSQWSLKEEDFVALQFSQTEFFNLAKKMGAFVFLGLHGGVGENGTLQKALDLHGIPYNGSGYEGSRICMDKALTADHVNAAQIPNVRSLEKIKIHKKDFSPNSNYNSLWQKYTQELLCSHIVIKPASDGCSSGVICLHNAAELKRYLDAYLNNEPWIPANTFASQSGLVELNPEDTEEFLLEPFIQVDEISINNHELRYEKQSGWIELTAGVTERAGHFHCLNPSITVASEKILSVEEKFQGGTGVNLTPPPKSIISQEQIETIKNSIAQVAQALQVRNYCRIDFFFNTINNELIVIEANSLPALTPSTVLYHQALAEDQPMHPTAFLESLVENVYSHLKCE
jgi:D-alanine--D-alanine ligase